MHENGGKTGKDGLIILTALLTLWFCVIIMGRNDDMTVSGDTSAGVLIIDAGHGGADGGACTADGRIESAYNLDIALRVRDLASFLGVKTTMTRESETLNYPAEADTISKMKKWDTRRRVELIHATPDAVLLSIHQNYYPDNRPHGAQVLYGKVGASRRFGELLQKNLTEQLDPMNSRQAEPISETIYLMSHAECTAALVECAFLSNERESALLDTDAYKLKIAAILAASYLQFTEDCPI